MTRILSAVALAIFVLVPELEAQSLRSGGFETVRAGFSAAVAVDGGRIFVGEPDLATTPGLVYVYEKNTVDDWTETERIRRSDGFAGDGFGVRIAAEGGTLVVASAGGDDAPGSVHVFSRSADGSWTQSGTLISPEGPAGDGFGAALALGGSMLLVGAPAAYDGQGAVYVYEQNADGRWVPGGRLPIADGAAGDAVGSSVALADGHAFAGAPGRRDREGVVYHFTYLEDGFALRNTLSAFGLDDNSRFGYSIAVHGESLVIGAQRHERAMGAVYTYGLEEGDWAQLGTLLPFDASPNMRFGTDVALSEGAVWVGSPGANQFTGALYLIEPNDDGEWNSAVKVAPHDEARQTGFGSIFEVEGDVAVVGRPGADGGAGTALVFERIDGDWMETAELMGNVDGMNSITGGEVDCTDGSAQGFDCSSIDLISFLSLKDMGAGRGVNLNDIWGWVDPVSEKEWALVGRTNGTAFVDLSNPENPVYVGELMLTDGGQPSSWRDMKVYADHVFIVADNAGNHGMQVFDLTRLRDVENPPVVFDADAVYNDIASAHNIVINEDTGYAYIVGAGGGGETCGGGLHMVNIQDPTHPTFAGCFSDTSTGRQGTGYSHDAMCVVYHGPDPDHQGREICFGSNETAISIADVTDKENPVALSNASYPNVSYAHQGWITDDHRYFYMNDELDELQGRVPSTRTLIWDITDLDDPQLIKEHQSATKASDHNLYVRGNYMYQSNYVAGLRVLDVSDPTNPVEIGYFDTVPAGENKPGFAGSWSNYPYFESGIVVVTSIQEGLFVLRRQDVDI